MAELLVMEGEWVVYLILGIMILLGSGCVCVTCCSAFRVRHEEDKWIPAPEYAPKAPHSWHKDPYKGLPPARHSERFKVRTKFRVGTGTENQLDEKWRRSRDKFKLVTTQLMESPAPTATQNAPAPELSTISRSYKPPPQYSQQIPVAAPSIGYPRY